MRLVRLALGALGPFPGEHTIDLDELGASGIFLLEGPTGSGKSTLIDAVVFALYGKVASADATEERLRSAHAPVDAETYVELTFATGSGLYRVRRTPAYSRPKQRGAGTTTQPATVRLWRLTSPDAPGEVLATRMDEAGLEIARVVGLDRQQFVQTVVLPQGEFAAFLRADPEQRRGVLQRVFGTEIYERVAQRLERMRVEAARTVAEAEAGVDRALARFAGAAAVPTEDDAADLSDRLARPTAVAATLAAEAEAAARCALAAARAAADVRDRLAARRSALAALTTRDRLRVQGAELAAAEPIVVEARRRVAEAEVAERLWPWVERATLAATRAGAAADRLEAARAAASIDLQTVVGSGDAEILLKALDAEIELGVTARGVLARALTLEVGLQGRRDDLVGRRTLLGARRAQLTADRAALAEAPEQRADRQRGLVRVRELAAGLPAARVALEDATRRVTAAREADDLTARLATADAELAAAVRVASAAVRDLAAAHEARIAGIAGELAAALVPGRPCGVCGSTEHPAPAPPAGPAPDPGAAEARRASAEAAVQAAATSVEVLRERLGVARAAAGDPDQATADLAAARSAVAAAEAAVGEEAELAADLARWEAELEGRRAEVEQTERDLAVAEVLLAEDEAALAGDEVEVLAAADGAPSVRARDETWRCRVDEARAWAEALRAWSTADEQARVAERERDGALAESGRSPAQVLAARLPVDQVRALSATVAEHEAALARLSAALADHALADLPDGPDVLASARAEVAAAEAALAQAEADLAASEGEAAVLRERATAAAQALTAAEAAVQAAAAARTQAAPVTRMANLATASGGEGALTLATYVLGQRFADLVAAANARLATVSDGRYELVRSTERESVRSRRLGLAMQVLDHATGRPRDPRTLSGGETFYVSLCLALGLADVVTAEAGGVELGTLLIDEGFGSLDAQTLDVVLAELGRLRDGGRVVGVVSHVDTLKSAIAERIEVRRRPDGTSTLRVVA